MLRFCLLVVGLWAIFAPAVHAHDVRGTVVFLDIGEARVHAEVQLPVQELRAALKLSAAAKVPLPNAERLSQYVRSHFGATTPSGEPFALDVLSVGPQRIDDGDCVVAHIVLGAPSGSSARAFVLRSDLILHEVMTHNAYVFVRRDLQSGLVQGRPELLGMLHFQSKFLEVDRSRGTRWQGFCATFRLGVRHIAEGTDHLLFLLVLLLPASLVAKGRRWAEKASVRRSALQIVAIVTAFTLGHSLTLLLGSLQIVSVSARAVEVLIAVSILVSAIHAITPLFPGREAWISGGFGLVHGLAFATVLRGLSLDPTTLVVSVLGFNLGIEAMQLAVVAFTMPWLLLLSRSASYAWLRIAGALVAGAASLVWIAERAFGVRTPFAAWIEQIASHGLWWLAGLAVVAVASQWKRPRLPPVSARD